MSGGPAYGPTERAYRTWIEGLGELSPRQAAEAEQVYAVAAQLDKARAGDLNAAAASLSRELRQLSSGLRETRTPAAPVDVEKPDVPADPIDELTRKRDQRRKGA